MEHVDYYSIALYSLLAAATGLLFYAAFNILSFRRRGERRKLPDNNDDDDDVPDVEDRLDALDPELRADFAAACEHVQSSLSSTLPQSDLLHLYGRYKLAVDGPHDAAQHRPSLWDARGRAKCGAWAEATAQCGGSMETAARQYVDYVRAKNADWVPSTTVGAQSTPSGGFGIRPSVMMRIGGEGGGEAEGDSEPVIIGAVKDDMPLADFDRLLRDDDVDACAADEHGVTAAHWACDAGRPEHLGRLLAAHPSLLDATDSERQTPLHYAAAGGHVECVRALLALGADAAAKDSDGCTPVELAEDEAVLECFSAQSGS